MYGNNAAALKAHTNPPIFMHFTKTLAASYPWKLRGVKWFVTTRTKEKLTKYSLSIFTSPPPQCTKPTWFRSKQQNAANFFFSSLCHPSPQHPSAAPAAELELPVWSTGASRSSAQELGQARSWSEQPTRLSAIPSPQPNERGVLTWKQASDLLPAHIKAHLIVYSKTSLTPKLPVLRHRSSEELLERTRFFPPSENWGDTKPPTTELFFSARYTSLMTILTRNYYNSKKLSVLTLLQDQRYLLSGKQQLYTSPKLKFWHLILVRTFNEQLCKWL